MYKRLCFLTFIVSIFLVSSASADAVWSGAALDGLWSTPGNWVGGVMPAPGQGNTILNDQTFGSQITIDTLTTVNVDGEVYGPEFGMDLDIVGGNLTQTFPNGFVFAPVGVDEPGRSVINLSDGANLTVHNLLLGDNWWFVAPYVTMNMYDTSTANATDWIWLGGYLNIYGGTMDIAGGFNMAINTAGMGVTKLDIHDGTLIIRGGDYSTQVNDWIANGYLTAYGYTPGGIEGTDIVVDTTTIPGGTIITAIPEPATIVLLGFGGLALIRRKRC